LPPPCRSRYPCAPLGPYTTLFRSAGTTGSGKSELPLTVLIGMVERYPPTEASLILLDFKGGSSFNILEPLPHTMSVETNHVASTDRKSTRLNSSHVSISYSVFCSK